MQMVEPWPEQVVCIFDVEHALLARTSNDLTINMEHMVCKW